MKATIALTLLRTWTLPLMLSLTRVWSTPLNLTTSNYNYKDASLLYPSLDLEALNVPTAGKWPNIPFKIRDPRTTPDNAAWVSFTFGGIYFNALQNITFGWDIGILLVRLAEIPKEDPCPPYQVIRSDTFFVLLIAPSPPTVATCIKIIKTFGNMVELWGARAINFDFGVGLDFAEIQGTFRMGTGLPPIPLLGTTNLKSLN